MTPWKFIITYFILKEFPLLLQNFRSNEVCALFKCKLSETAQSICCYEYVMRKTEMYVNISVFSETMVSVLLFSKIDIFKVITRYYSASFKLLHVIINKLWNFKLFRIQQIEILHIVLAKKPTCIAEVNIKTFLIVWKFEDYILFTRANL